MTSPDVLMATTLSAVAGLILLGWLERRKARS
jgi:hypothetical protein